MRYESHFLTLVSFVMSRFLASSLEKLLVCFLGNLSREYPW